MIVFRIQEKEEGLQEDDKKSGGPVPRDGKESVVVHSRDKRKKRTPSCFLEDPPHSQHRQKIGKNDDRDLKERGSMMYQLRIKIRVHDPISS